MPHEHQKEYMREKDSATLYSKLKDQKCDKTMHFKETAQISLLTKLP